MDLEEDLLPKEADEADLHGQLEDFRDLMQTAGWHRFVKVINESILDKRTKVIFESIVNANEGDYMQNLLLNEYDKGFLKGLAFAVGLPSTQVAILANQLGLDREEKETN